jgi:hypothetical protein
LPKITILRWFFPSKLTSKCCNFSMDWDRVKCLSALVRRYLMINRAILSLSHVQNFLGDGGGGTPPFIPPKQKGAHPPSGNPLIYLLNGGSALK